MIRDLREARAERDRAHALLREASRALYHYVRDPALIERIDAHLRGEQEG